jgi:Nucleotide-diphospho-sugar transferase
MGSEKPKAVLRLFDEIQARTVVLADTDTIWLRDPFPFFEEHPQADMFVTTDCLSHEAEVHSIINLPRCGHVEGSLGGGWALNTGAVFKLMQHYSLTETITELAGVLCAFVGLIKHTLWVFLY